MPSFLVSERYYFFHFLKGSNVNFASVMINILDFLINTKTTRFDKENPQHILIRTTHSTFKPCFPSNASLVSESYNIKYIFHFPIRSNFKTMSSDGSHLGFLIDIKKKPTHFVWDQPRHIPAKFPFKWYICCR